MSLSKTKFGDFELFTIETGDFKLDGGAMFGVVPKTLWSRSFEVDEKNRIPMTMRCLLIRSTKTDRMYLIDNGAGSKFNDKMKDIYQLDNSSKELHRSLSEHGFTVSDITDVIFTHLHFDHCGGTTYYTEEGDLEHTFPNATYHVAEAHWKSAIEPNAREKASFLPENIGPLQESDNLHLVPEGYEFEPGLDTVMANGHTTAQQLPRITDGTKTLIFVADLLPTHVHLPLAWVMGYDMRPLETLDEKARFLNEAIEKEWFLYLEHDIEKEIITISTDGRKYTVKDSLTLNEL
ncbi:MAG TPA: MBL fold metallo-hydrolase [Balneolaceae bacterium]|nr:MBL fold metallo-hydrolase [Balneolaceae bacterium]|tara:strand:- start:12097 stop:12972 length:876 start_codon:yes stop_codon:yes gene_type:complete